MTTATYTVPLANLPVLRDKVEKLNRRAARLGLAAVGLSVEEEDIVLEVRVPDEGSQSGYKKIKVIHRRVEVSGEPVTELGWTFVATLHHEGEGETLVAALPGEEIPTAYRWANNVCDHCGAARRRNATFLIRREEDGRIFQVGRNCLQDFLPRWDRDPANLARWAEVYGAFWISLKGVEEPEWGGASRPEWTEDLERFLTVTSAVMRSFGWLSRGQSRERGGAATADIVLDYLTLTGKAGAALREEVGEPEDADKARAGAVVAWAEESLLKDDETLSDYEHNLSIVTRLGLVRLRHVGLAASMIRAWQRATGASEDGRPREKREPSAHVGEEGARVRLHGVEVSFTMEMEDRGYGASLLVKMLHDGKNVLTWFASASAAWPQKGDRINLKGTVKRHGEYKGTAETQLTRVVWDLDGADPDADRPEWATPKGAGVEKGKVDFDDREEAVL